MFCEENIRVIVKANVGLAIYSQPDPARGIEHYGERPKGEGLKGGSFLKGWTRGRKS